MYFLGYLDLCIVCDRICLEVRDGVVESVCVESGLSTYGRNKDLMNERLAELLWVGSLRGTTLVVACLGVPVCSYKDTTRRLRQKCRH